MRRPASRAAPGAAALAFAVLATGGSAAPGRADAAAAPARLNVVVILADDQRADSNVRMTEVQRLLAARGVTFVNAFVSTSECCPSRATLLTGQYAHHTGVVQNFGPSSYPRFDESNNLAVWLHDAGYQTGLVGKYLNDYTIFGNHHVPPGWSTWTAMDSVPEERYYDYTLNENGKLVHYGIAPSDYSTEVLARRASDFVRTAPEPFFLYFTPIAPHLPATPAERDLTTPLKLPARRPSFNERDLSDKPWHTIYKRVLGPSAIHYLDGDIEGKQLRSLRDLDRTVVVYASDNGFMWGEHRLGGKIWPYEESIRVPLVVRVRGRARGGESTRTWSSTPTSRRRSPSSPA